MKISRMAMAAVAVATAVMATACSFSTYDERIQYLQKTAQRGADMHAYLVAQEAFTDKGRCERAFEGSQVERDMPDAGSTITEDMEAWKGQIKEFFVDSCVSGKPKAVPGDVVPSPSISPVPSPSVSPTRSPASPSA